MFDPTTLVGFHTWLSLVAIVAGFPVTAGLLKGHTRPGWTGVFLSTAFATSATGYALPAPGLLPSHIVGAISLALIVVAGFALYAKMLEGPWRRIYAIVAVLAFYLLLFVLVAQLFLKVPALHALAPTGSEPPFAIVQGILLVFFAWLTWRAARRFTQVWHPVIE
ncbi:hypothetical protein [Bosea sp. (in: a-proteobacteria)]|uniref:hypothetical protein n=1 Tax=Bosea sp. (in: a-proteobacteria) TaxID=1871050 RepID=UPI001AD41703|nr:hypothetical protein [Bosea sp. (in: a-proteobacteria)]MBN9441076.1 hypothetical protein [Bosea sp. (in: a-proteobacteria)]